MSQKPFSYSPDDEKSSSALTEEQRALVEELVADGLSIQHKFKAEPLYKKTDKGHYQSDTVAEIRRAREEFPESGKES